MAQRYRVTLIKEERKDLEAISKKGKRAARTDTNETVLVRRLNVQAVHPFLLELQQSGL